MSFDWDKYASSTGNFVSGPEKLALAEGGIPITIKAIRQVHKFDKENFELTIDMPDPATGDEEERILSFPIGSGAESRDALLAGLKAHLDEGGEPQVAKVTKVGRAFFLAPVA